MTETTGRIERFLGRHYALVKLSFLLVLILVLMVPLGLVESLVAERMARRQVAVADINDAWGRAQALTGPVLIVPCLCDARAFFLPDELELQASVAPEVRYRGIFEATVYSASVQVSGSFRPPELEPLGIDVQDLLWREAVLAFGVTDLRGIVGEPQVTWGGQRIPFAPGTTSKLLGKGVSIPVALDPAEIEPTRFAFTLDFTGSRSISFTPAAKTTRVQVGSPWPAPSFGGAYLPAEREVRDDGFSARWRISYLGREYPQSWVGQDAQASKVAKQVRASRFGVSLVSPVDFYLKSERSVKYGLLFVVLIFAATFMAEILASLKVHVIQYALVGFALCLFYLLLLSLAEIIGFTAAYGLAAAASTALIALYMGKVLASRQSGLLIAGVLAGVYAYLFVILQLESYALVSGSIGLFLALAAVMYATRNVNWYAMKRA